MTTAPDGITIVDLTHGKAGALAGVLLCDNGARVIRVEPPDCDSSRSTPGYIIWDRGKESVSLDIEKDRQTFHKLVSVADVLLESFGKMKYSSNSLRFGNTEKVAGRRTPLLGENNRDAPGEVGYSADKLQELYEEGVIFTDEPSRA